MFQLSWKVLLALSMFASIALAIPLEEIQPHSTNSTSDANALVAPNINETHQRQLDHSTESPKVNGATKQQETSSKEEKDAVTKNANSTSTPSPKLSETVGPAKNVSSIATRPVEETTPMGEIRETEKAGDFTGEQADFNNEEYSTTEIPEMVHVAANSSVKSVESNDTHHPDLTYIEFVPVVRTHPSNTTQSTVATIEADNNDTESTDGTVSSNVETDDAKTIDSGIEHSTKSVDFNYVTIPSKSTDESCTETIATKAIEASTVTPVEKKRNENDTVLLEGLQAVEQAELSGKSKAEEATDKASNGGSMSSSIIALVTTITFAVAIVIGYISMVVWKQYLEHRYGRRELLVNELEFDTNDLRHFEL